MNRCTCPQWEPSVYAKHTAERQISIDCPIHGEPTRGQLNIRIRELEAELAASAALLKAERVKALREAMQAVDGWYHNIGEGTPAAEIAAMIGMEIKNDDV